MIKCFLLVAFFFASATGYCQQTDSVPSPGLSKDELIKKSRTQKVVGWLMAGTGAPVVIATIYFMTFPDDAIEKDKVVLALVGSVAYTFIGINLIKAGRKNNEKALSIGLREQGLLLPFTTRATIRTQPAVSLRLRF